MRSTLIHAFVYAPEPTATAPADEGAATTSWWESVPWVELLIILLIVLAVAAIVWAIVVWRRKRAAAAAPRAAGPTAGERLGALWEPFYHRLPTQALHYPTVVVMGEAGVGKSHTIGCHVDWRGQANQFMHSVDHGAAMQLYLGPGVVVHELSAPVLRDVGHDVKRALQGLWRNMGPSATVVVALDARTLLTTPPSALRELAQLVRGKISLFPQRCQAALDVRIYLSHLDQIEGYEEFAAAIGSDYGSLALGESGDGQADAQRLLAAFDAHLAYALTTRTGEAFDRMVRFYAVLPELVVGLTPLLEVFAGKDTAFAQRYPVSALYLGSHLPHSQVGDPFAVERSLIAGSMGRQRRRGLRGSVAMATFLSGLVFGLMTWHGQKIAAAEDAVETFSITQDDQADVDYAETVAANEVLAALEAMHRSEILWFERSFQGDKDQVDERFEAAIRKSYLEPKLNDSDRVELLYVTALIYASRDNDLGRLILDNSGMWADNLDLEEWVIDTYVTSSRDAYDKPVDLPEIALTGSEWSNYLHELDGVLADDVISREEADSLREDLPALRGPREYEVLTEVRQIMEADVDLSDRLAPLLSGSLDSWAGAHYGALESLRAMILRLRTLPGDTTGWGLAQLVRGLGVQPKLGPPKPFVIESDGGTFDSDRLATVILRSRRHELLTAVLDQLDAQRPQGGRGFVSEGVRLSDAGDVSGYGGGPTRRIAGMYTRETFEVHVAPVLRFAAEQLSGSTTAVVEAKAEAEAEAEVEAEPGAEVEAVVVQRVDLDAEDRRRLERAIREAGVAYAASYRQELYAYYESFEFRPGSEVALPFVLKTFVEPTSWFTEYLTTVSRNAALELPDDDVGGYFEPMREALEEFEPLITLLFEDGRAIPGLEPYQALMAALQTRVAGTVGESGDPEAEDLLPRLSALGSLALGTVTGTEMDYQQEVAGWLLGAGLDPSWHAPFLAPVESVHTYGLLDIKTKVATAWIDDVRPQAERVLAKYPFDPTATEDASVEELEAFLRMQGDLPGAFWLAFDRLIRPAMEEGEITMIDGVHAPWGMLTMARDLEDMAQTLWDDKGERLPLEISVKFQALPKQPLDGLVAAMASLGSGGASVYGFNQRPEPQTMMLAWWDQGTSVVLLKMGTSELEGGKERRFQMAASSTFSFYRLLDLSTRRKIGDYEATLTEVAIARAVRCNRRGANGSTGVSVSWPVPVGAHGKDSRSVQVVLVSDPWAPFAIRSCR